MPLQAIFFDAGNTLVYADPDKILVPLAQRGVRPAQEQLYAAERHAKRQLDASRAATPEDHSIDKQFWDIYYGKLLELIGLRDEALCSALSAATRQSVNWDRVLPDTRDVLERLRRRHRLGIISNSDGGMRDLLYCVGLGDCFEAFTDSGIVGHEKPDVRIFQAALRELAVAPSESLYVGDVYSVDYLGAKSAGMDAILIDRSGTYRNSDFPRVESLQELEQRLKNRA